MDPVDAGNDAGARQSLSPAMLHQLRQLEQALRDQTRLPPIPGDAEMVARRDRSRLPPHVVDGRFASIAVVAGPDRRQRPSVSTVAGGVARSATRGWAAALASLLMPTPATE